MDTNLEAVATQLFVTLNTPRALSCLILMRHREWDQLATMATRPLDYLDTVTGAYHYYLDNMASSFLRKCPLLKTSWDREENAKLLFQKSEKQCAETNYCLSLYQHLPAGESRVADRLLEILRGAKKLAGRILGPLPNSLEFGFGPGTCFELRERTFSTLGDKVDVTPHVTRPAEMVFDHIYRGTIMDRVRTELGRPYLEYARGNRFTTVPKDGKTNRGICIEPLGNLAVQLGIGRYLKGRLSRVGLHVNTSGVSDSPLDWRVARKDGQTIHRQLAYQGSLDGTLATIDLSNASDTISRELVRLVLPDEWYSLLDAVRSRFTLFEGRWCYLEKFSSMGNGFTFELETLLFACILATACSLKVGHDIHVYGDDIILPSTCYREASAVLEACGFTPNPSKSFSTGPFRESCGGDFFLGYNVRPLYVKGDLSSPLEWISLHNSLRRLVPFRNRLVLERCVRPIPVTLRVRGPSWLSDLVLHSADYRPFHRDGSSWVYGVVAKPRRVPLDRYSGFELCLAVLGCESTGIPLRKEVDGYRRVRVSVS